jgi:hypothetical protein
MGKSNQPGKLAKLVNEFLYGLKYKTFGRAQIDSDAAALLHSSAIAVKAILDKRAELDRNGRQATPLFVNLGEYHDVPAHKLHHIAVIDGVRKAGEKIAVTMETEQDISLQQFFWGQPPKLLPGIEYKTPDYSDGRLALKIQGNFISHSAQQAVSALFHYLILQDIPVHMSDCSRLHISGMNFNALNFYHKPTRESALKYVSDLNNLYNMQSRTGMNIRNHHMAAQSIDFAHQTGARIVFQECGQGHTIGGREFPPEESLSGHFQKNNMPVLSVLLSPPEPEEDALSEEIKAAVLGHEIYRADKVPERYFGSYGRNAPDTGEGTAYTNAMLHATGLAETFNGNGIDKKAWQKYLPEIQAKFAEWNADYNRQTQEALKNRPPAPAPGLFTRALKTLGFSR